MQAKISTESREPRAEKNKESLFCFFTELGSRLSAQHEGFLLIEALLASLILSLVLVASLGGVAQALQLSHKAEETTKAILEAEEFLFGLETGERLDLVLYGGRGEWQKGLKYEIRSEPQSQEEGLFSFHHLKTRFFFKSGKEFLDLDALIGGSYEF